VSVVPGSDNAINAAMIVSPMTPPLIRFPVDEVPSQINVAATDAEGNLTYYCYWYELLRRSGFDFSWMSSQPISSSISGPWVPSIAVRSNGEVDVVGPSQNFKATNPGQYYWLSSRTASWSAWGGAGPPIFKSWSGPVIAIDADDTAQVICTTGVNVEINGQYTGYSIVDYSLPLGSSQWFEGSIAVGFPDITEVYPAVISSQYGLDLICPSRSGLVHFSSPPGGAWGQPDFLP
jgi:hypothetical protein